MDEVGSEESVKLVLVADGVEQRAQLGGEGPRRVDRQEVVGQLGRVESVDRQLDPEAGEEEQDREHRERAEGQVRAEVRLQHVEEGLLARVDEPRAPRAEKTADPGLRVQQRRAVGAVVRYDVVQPSDVRHFIKLCESVGKSSNFLTYDYYERDLNVLDEK